MSKNIIQYARLHCTLRGSNKEIRMFIIETEGGYLMNYENGPFEGQMTARTKTAKPVSLDEAQSEFNKLLKAKVKPTEYRIIESTLSGDTGITPPVSNRVESGYATLLLSDLKNDAHHEQLMDDPRYVIQEKHDGMYLKAIKLAQEIIGSVKKGAVTGIPSTITDSLKKCARDFVIDGENVGGHHYVFDCPSVDGLPAQASFEERCAALQSLNLDSKFVHIVPCSGTSRASKQAMIDDIAARDGEGYVFKCLDGPYVDGRSKHFFRFKFWHSATVVVLDHTKGARSVITGLLDAKGNMVRMKAVTIPENVPMPPIGSIIEVKYQNANPATHALQQPSYKGVRGDQELSDCLLSQLKYKKPKNHASFTVESDEEMTEEASS